jgi:simple sugar transport system permease protein
MTGGGGRPVAEAVRPDHPPEAPGRGTRPVVTRSWNDLVMSWALYAATILGAMAISSLIVALAGGSPTDVLDALVRGSVGSETALVVTINQTAPLMIVALGSVVAFRAGLVNIGTEGQLLLGAMFGAWLGLNVSGPGPVMIPAVLLAAALGGGIWSGLAAVMQYWRRVNVVISTLLLNFVGYQLLSLAVTRSYLLQESGDAEYKSAQSDLLPRSVRLPRFGWLGLDFHSGIVLAMALAVVVAFVLSRTHWGFHVRMLGLNPMTARAVGVRAAVVGGGALVLSGAVAGLAGGVMLTGTVFRMQDGFTNNVGWEGLLVGLVARRRPLVVVPVAFFFGALRAGGGFLASTGVARFLVDIVQALLVLAAVLPPVILDARRRARIAQQQTARA